jgi:hypothetical protein
MPWKECSVDERQFVARRLAGEAMAELCWEFGISRVVAGGKGRLLREQKHLFQRA